jgi:ankyrin repeat protein
MIRCLVESGHANLLIINKAGETALSIVCTQHCSFDMVHYILSRQAQAKAETAGNGAINLLNAFLNGHLDLVDSLITILLASGVYTLDAWRNAPRMNSLQGVHAWIHHCPVVMSHDDCKAHVKTVLYLINEGQVDVNASDKQGSTALHRACALGNFSLVQSLVETYHANVEATNNDGETPLHHSTWRQGNLATVKYLVETGGSNVEATDQNGHTVLHHAYSHRMFTTLQYLADKASRGRNAAMIVTNDDQDGWPSLYWVSLHSVLSFIHYLINTCRASVEVVNRECQIALHRASRNGNLELVQRLFASGRVNVDATDGNALGQSQGQPGYGTSIGRKTWRQHQGQGQ